jgi:hypothetical protein
MISHSFNEMSTPKIAENPLFHIVRPSKKSALAAYRMQEAWNDSTFCRHCWQKYIPGFKFRANGRLAWFTNKCGNVRKHETESDVLTRSMTELINVKQAYGPMHLESEWNCSTDSQAANGMFLQQKAVISPAHIMCNIYHCGHRSAPQEFTKMREAHIL